MGVGVCAGYDWGLGVLDGVRGVGGGVGCA